MSNELSAEERNVVHRPRCSEDENGLGCDCGAREVVTRIVAARVAAVEQERDGALARIAAAEAALAMSDHEPTNRVWHEQMQRVRAALAATPEAPSYSDGADVDAVVRGVVADRAWATRFLAAWSAPYFGDDARDAVAAVMRAAEAAGLDG